MEKHIVKILKAIYAKQEIVIGDKAQVLGRGLSHGRVLSPLLSNIYLEDTIAQIIGHQELFAVPRLTLEERVGKYEVQYA